MGAMLGLLSALCYGVSDFTAGVGGRRGDPTAVAAIAQSFGLLAAIVAVLATHPQAPSAAALGWGTLSGVGSAVGILALYWGLSAGSMSVVAPVSAVLTAALPALVGLLLGERLTPIALAGIALVVPALVLVPLQGGPQRGSRWVGAVSGLVAGGGFALLFVALARAGTRAGAYPLLPGQALGVVLVALVVRWRRPSRAAWRAAAVLGAVTGVLGGSANLLYLAATGHGQLAVVAVLAALYPAFTVLLARVVLRERLGLLQTVGLVVAAVAVVMIAAG